MTTINIADLFCGAGGTSTGAVEAAEALGYRASLTAVNHWPRAVETHSANHPTARHYCASIDSLNPREIFKAGQLDLLWASPECTHHSRARGGAPMSDQSRASAFCVTRWAEALRPPTVLIENVPEFAEWGPLGHDGKPLRSRKGETFKAWIAMMEAIGYKADVRLLCAADYGDPTTRRRLFVQFQLGRRRIVWPDPTHSDRPDLFGSRAWIGADRGVIDWSLPMKSIFGRKRPLAEKTLRRIAEGLEQHGGATIIAMEHGGRTINPRQPLPTVTCAKGGAFGFAYILGQHGGASLRPASDPCPTVATAGAIRLIVEYYGNGRTHPVNRPLPTVTCNDRFALIKAQGGDILFRMLRWHELAAAQGFRRDYRFTGTTTEITKQIGNAVPRNLARAICLAAIGQGPDISPLIPQDEPQMISA